MMSFNDDELPPANSSAGPKPVRPGDRVRLEAHCNDKAPLEVNWQQVLLEIIDTSSTSERAGLDLVAVLDVSTSMEGYKLDKLKRAMKFVISKLGPMDRLSVVSFSTQAKKWCGLRFMSEAAKEELKDMVEKGLVADGNTNMRDGLETGLRVLAERRHSGGRVSSIVFMSDGQENHPWPLVSGGARNVNVGDVAVYTFGFGEDHDAELLELIASKSLGGTFHYVSDEKSFTEPFAEILGGLLSVVVQDLKLTIRQQPGHSTIRAKDVYAGSYLPVNDSAGLVTVSFGDLFSGEVRKVTIGVLLPAVHSECRVPVLAARCSYRSASEVAMNTKVEQELERISYVRKIDEVIDTKDQDIAQSKLREHQKVLEAKPPNHMIRNLMKELQQLLNLKTWAALLATLLEFKVSHNRQRGGQFATQRMVRYEKQAVEFEKDPSKPPPSVADDAKEEEEQAAAKKKPVAEQRPWVVWVGSPERMSSGGLAWAMVVLCTVLATAVIVAGAAVLAVYMLLRPKMPYLAVSDAQLGLLQYDQLGGTIQSLQLTITILAENNNSKADATFSRVDLALGFDGVDVALLRAEPFVVAPESSLPLQYNVVSAGRTLDADRIKAMDAALEVGMLPLDLLGKARTRWKVGVFVRLRYWTRISCRLRFFFPGNGTVMPTDRDRCRSR